MKKIKIIMPQSHQDFPGGSAGKKSICNVGLGSVPGLGRSPGEGNSYSLQYSDLENSMDCIVHGVTKSQTRLSDFHFTFTTYPYIKSSYCSHKIYTIYILK